MLQFPLDARHARPATKALKTPVGRPAGWEEDGKENRGHPPKTPPRRVFPNERAEPDVHLIIIAPNESHSLTALLFSTLHLRNGFLRPTSTISSSSSPPPPTFHFRLHASAFCCTLSNRCYDSRKPVPPLPGNKSWNIYEVGKTGPTLFLLFFFSFFSFDNGRVVGHGRELKR